MITLPLIGYYIYAYCNKLPQGYFRTKKFFINYINIAFLFVLFPCRLLAWGHAGHAMVAELAMSMLSDATRVKVERVLGGMTPADAGSWMDEVRSDPKYKYTTPWHYVNIESGGTYKPAPNGDIITALNKAYTELQNPEKLTPEQVKFDVLVLFHLCGDLMQPLHVGYGSDKGGNTYQVQYNGKGTNLHSVWDTRIIESQDITLTDLKDAIDLPQPIDPKKKPFKASYFGSYLKSGRNDLQFVYSIEGHKIDESYMKNNKLIVISELCSGGMLLANCLETLLSQVKNVTAGPATPTPSASKKSTGPGKTLTSTGTITPDQAAAHIGETVTVCGKVYSTKALSNGPTFINMGAEYPGNPFTAVIMFNKRGIFSYMVDETYNGKTICVTGTVKNYKGKPEIVVNKEDQIKIQ